MIEFLRGRLIEKNPAYLIIDCNGIGYFVNISVNTFSAIADKEELKILTHLQITEDAHTLYGFISEEERKIFRLLITVSGIGCNTARMMLSSMSVAEIENCIVSENAKKLQSIKGIGEKTALRAILELKAKLKKETIASHAPYLKIRDEALSALLTLGFNKQAVDKMLDQLIKAEPSTNVEDLIKNALKTL